MVAILAYRHASKVKKLDLLVEAGRARNELASNFVTLVDLHGEALRSRKAVASATGKLRGGAMQKWQTEWEGDKAFIQNHLTPYIPRKDTDYASLKADKLVAVIVELDHLNNSVVELLEKYGQWQDFDNNERDQIREDVRTRYLTKESHTGG